MLPFYSSVRKVFLLHLMTHATYVGETDSIRRVDIERLGLGMSRTARRGVSSYITNQTTGSSNKSYKVLTVADTHPALETSNSSLIKYIPDHTIRLDLIESTTRPASDDTSGVLASVANININQRRRTSDS